MTEHFYGEPPVTLGSLDLSNDWHEFMHYLYLPVRIPTRDTGLRAVPSTHLGGVTVPERLSFLTHTILTAWYDAAHSTGHLDDPYVYVTARRGHATPGNPLNRPGWHTDDFGGTDLNYVWTDAYPTQFLLADKPLDIPADDRASMQAMTDLATSVGPNGGYDIDGVEEHTDLGLRIEDGPLDALLRLTPHVIHAAPEIPEPGGMRSFFKISVSTHRYNLLGNSHNYDLNYDWVLHDRQALRNQPQGGQRDHAEEK